MTARLARSARLFTLAAATTLPAAAFGQIAPPYLETFESFNTCGTTCGNACTLPAASGWVNVTTDQRDWTVDVGGTTSGATGPSVDHTTSTASGRYLYTESSNACSNDVAILLSPVLNVAGTTAPVVTFWLHQFGNTMGTLTVDLLEGAQQVPRTVIAARTGNVNAWQEVTVPLDPAAGTVQVRFRADIGPSFRSDMAIDDFEFFDALPDVGVIAVRRAGNCPGSEFVEVDIQNFGGGAPIPSLQAQYTINGGAPVTETLVGPFDPFSSTTRRFAVPATLAVGSSTITVSLTFAGDSDLTNNSVSLNRLIKPILSGFPLTEDFETGDGGWSASGTPLWARGTPADTVLNGAQGGTQAWVTRLNGDYPNNALAFLESACFDGTTLTNPRLDMFINYEAEFSWDGAQVQTSTDGVNWIKVGTPGNGWYNDGTIAGLGPTGSQQGFTGRANTNNGSRGWRRVAHDLGNGTAGSVFQVRIVFGSDTSVVDEGVAIDTVTIEDNPPRLDVTDVTLPGISAFPPGATDVFVQALQLDNRVAASTLQALTISKQGTLPDTMITAVRLWRDDGDGIPEPGTGDTLIAAPATFSGGFATFTIAPALALAGDSVELLFVTFDLGLQAAGGLTFGSSVPSPGLVTVTNNQVVMFPNGSVSSPLSSTFAPTDILPFADNFDGAAVTNRRALERVGTFPTATSTGTQVGVSAVTANDATIGIVNTVAGINPNSDPNLAAIAFVNGPATGAIDYYFDLTSYDVMLDDIFVEVFWNNIAQTDDPEDNIFVSLDGGLTWTGSLYNFDFTSPVPSAWTRTQVDLSAMLRAANLAFTNNVVVRVQAAGGPTNALLIDDVWTGIPENIRVERVPGSPIASGSIDDLMAVPGGSVVPVTYVLHNDGQRALQVSTSSITVSNESNVTVMPMGNVDANIAPGATATVSFGLVIATAGAFSADVAFATNDPRLSGPYTLTMSGVGVFDPDIEIVMADGTPLPSGGTQSFGRVRLGTTLSAGYEVRNVGGGPLTLTGTPAVALVNLVNLAVATASTVPRNLPALTAQPFGVMLEPMGRGDFSAEILVMSNDPDEGMYVVTATGTAVEPDIHVLRGGNDLPTGSADDLGLTEVGVSQTLSYTVQNLGNEVLLLTGSPTVVIGNVTGAVTASVSAAPGATLDPASNATLDIDVVADAEGMFSFDIQIASDDPDESPYTIQVTGTGFVPAPEIQVSRGGAEVPSGSTEDAGNSLPGVAQIFTYSVTNPGTLDLELSGVTTENPNNVEATISVMPATTIAPGASETLEVSFTPSAEGDYTFDIVISSNDADEGTYTISVRGTGDSQAPEIAVQAPTGTDRADGDTIDLGEVDVGAAQTVMFTVSNQGAGPLSLTGDPRVTVESLTNATANVDSQPNSPVEAGGSTTFEVSVTAAAAGAFSAQVTLPNDDGNESPYRLTIAGTGKGTDPNNPDPNNPDPTNPREEDGCSCTATATTDGSPAWVGLLGLGLLALLRRRRRR